MNIVLRNYDKTLDYGFIISTWPKSVYYGNYRAFENKKKWFEDKYQAINSDLTLRHTRVAVSIEDPSFIFGYAISVRVDDEIAVQFVYVKEVYRCQGIAKLLCSWSDPLSFKLADWTDLGRKIIANNIKKEIKHAESLQSNIHQSSESSERDAGERV